MKLRAGASSETGSRKGKEGATLAEHTIYGGQAHRLGFVFTTQAKGGLDGGTVAE